MERRQVISAVGTVGLGGAVVWFAYQVDQGTIDLPGEEPEVSERVDRNPEAFGFEASADDDIFITIRELDEGRRRGSLELVDPEGERVFQTRFSPSGRTSETHTADTTGRYTLRVDPEDGRYDVSISIDDSDE